MTREYPTADTSRCQDCGVLPGRDHLKGCNSPAARRQRQEWLREEAGEGTGFRLSPEWRWGDGTPSDFEIVAEPGHYTGGPFHQPGRFSRT